MQNISCRKYYVDYMSYEGRLYELCELYEYFMNHLKSIELFEIKYLFAKILHKDGKFK